MPPVYLWFTRVTILLRLFSEQYWSIYQYHFISSESFQNFTVAGEEMMTNRVDGHYGTHTNNAFNTPLFTKEKLFLDYAVPWQTLVFLFESVQWEHIPTLWRTYFQTESTDLKSACFTSPHIKCDTEPCYWLVSVFSQGFFLTWSLPMILFTCHLLPVLSHATTSFSFLSRTVFNSLHFILEYLNLYASQITHIIGITPVS